MSLADNSVTGYRVETGKLLALRKRECCNVTNITRWWRAQAQAFIAACYAKTSSPDARCKIPLVRSITDASILPWSSRYFLTTRLCACFVVHRKLNLCPARVWPALLQCGGCMARYLPGSNARQVLKQVKR